MTRVASLAFLAAGAAVLIGSPASAQGQPTVGKRVSQGATAIPRPAAPTGPVYRGAPALQPYVATSGVNAAITDWRRLRQTEGYPFATYASFVIANPGFPGETTIRRSAEKAMRPGEYAPTVLAFFRSTDPRSGNGWARFAEALAASGRPTEALSAARSALSSGDLSSADEAGLLSRFAGQLTTIDYDHRVDALLFDKKPTEAERLIGWTSPARRAAFAARVALQRRSVDAEQRYAAVIGQVTSDAGLMMDRARYLRDTGNEQAARSMAARPHNYVAKPIDAERFTDMLVLLARGAMADRQWTTAFNIARQIDDLFEPGTVVSKQSYAVRDNYTTLAWIAGQTALERISRPADAVAMFDRYARGGKSLQVASKGYYWAGRAAARAGQSANTTRYFQQAAAMPELFYGQLALERLGLPVPAPGNMPGLLVTDAQRQEFFNRRVVAAIRQLGAAGYRSEQALFIRSLSESLETDADRVLAAELAAGIGRQDLAVWTARSARNDGASFYYRPAFPTHSFATSTGRLWSLAHGITRQESSFDRSVVSHANAHGMMQVVPSTGREQADKMGIAFDSGRLTSDPAFNVLLGTAYFQRMLNNWGGSYPLAVAAYNAGSGNVRKWINTYGDPRTGAIDIVDWIERIPFEETRGYVQRVLENSVVYDTINPTSRPVGAVHLSAYLGKTSRPG